MAKKIQSVGVKAGLKGNTNDLDMLNVARILGRFSGPLWLLAKIIEEQRYGNKKMNGTAHGLATIWPLFLATTFVNFLTISDYGVDVFTVNLRLKRFLLPYSRSVT